jgi:hypothetical protein
VRRNVLLQLGLRVALRFPSILQRNDKAIGVRGFLLDCGPLLLLE